jgi:hypothetical protein
MSRLRVLLVVCAVSALSLVLVASASAYSFTMPIADTLWPNYQYAKASAVCVGNYSTGSTGVWYNESCQTHWYYTKLTSDVKIALQAWYQVAVYSQGNLKWQTTQTQGYVFCDEWYNRPPAPAH